MIPANPELFTTRMRGAELRRLLEVRLERTFSGDVLRQQGGYVIRFAGMRAVARPNNLPGQRLVQLEVAGASVEDEREYVVAAAGEQSVPRGTERTMLRTHAVDAVRRQLHDAGPFTGSGDAAGLIAV